ncbi:hypothetical protein Pfo_016837 [Paulownia fortunei]|nr:hypothetical protein Pfo_016837 [Paulownia fortunei]
MEKDRAYTLSQVAQHKSKKDCWFTINGRVLDVTKFLEEHPGGEELLIEYAGKDATKGFEAVGHSKEAHNLVSKFQVGYLQGYNIKQLDDHSDKQLPKGREMEAFVIKEDPKPGHKVLVEFFVPVLVAGLYFGYRCMTGAVYFGS